MGKSKLKYWLICFIVGLAVSAQARDNHMPRPHKGAKITSEDIVDGEVKTRDLADGAVTEEKIQDGAIKFRHLSPETLNDLVEFMKDFFLEGPGPGIPLCSGFFCADLVPAVVSINPDTGDCEFCGTLALEGGRIGLKVAIKNQGTFNAPASVTRVSFDPGGGANVVNLNIPTPPIPIGFTVELHDLQEIPFPDSCSDGCAISFCADADSQVQETDEGNNCHVCGFFVP